MNLIKLIFILLTFMSFSLYSQEEKKASQNAYIPLENDIQTMHSYCFEDGTCTNYMIMSIHSIKTDKVEEYLDKGNFVKIDRINKRVVKTFSRIKVPLVNPKTATEEEVINQLLLAFQIYNVCCFSKGGCSIYCNFKLEYFFENLDFEEKYRIEFPNNDFIEVIGLKNMKRFDLKRKIIEEKKEPGFMEISFEEHEGVQIKCSENYYEETLFPGHLNFISKNPRFTRKQLRVEKVDMQKKEFDY